MRQLLFLLGSVGGFWMLAQRYRKAPLRKKVNTDTPINVGDGSIWIGSPGIDDATLWDEKPLTLTSPNDNQTLLGGVILVSDGTQYQIPAGTKIVEIEFDNKPSLTITSFFAADGSVTISLADPNGGKFTDPAHWGKGKGRRTYKLGKRIVRIKVNGQIVYEAANHDSPHDQDTHCVLGLQFGS